MRRPDPREGSAPVVRGAGEAAVEEENDKANTATHGTTLAERPCFCHRGNQRVFVCVTCLDWSRRIRGIEARLAGSLRRQAQGASTERRA